MVKLPSPFNPAAPLSPDALTRWSRKLRRQFEVAVSKLRDAKLRGDQRRVDLLCAEVLPALMLQERHLREIGGPAVAPAWKLTAHAGLT